MAESIFRSWWARIRGRLIPKPCPYSHAWILQMPMRSINASPKRILRAFNLKAGEIVLEIGPGTGYYSLQAARSVLPNGRLICLDIQFEMLRELRSRFLKTPDSPADLVQGDALNLPMHSKTVNHVFLITVLGELPNRPEALLEIRRVLRSDGRLSISEQFPDPDFITRGTLRRELSRVGFVEQATHGRLVYASTWRLRSSSAEVA